MNEPGFTTEIRNAADAAHRLAWLYENPAVEAMSAARSGVPVVGMTSNTIPWELVRAAGAFPCVIRPENSNHPDIGAFMEEGVFERRMRDIFGAALAGGLRHLDLLLISRTSEQEYKLYLYLREVARQDPDRPIPPLYLYDLLHARSPEAYCYGLERTLRLKERLEELTERRIQDTDLLDAVEESNAARNSIRQLLDLRRQGPNLAGTEALALIGASFFVDRKKYGRLAGEIVEGIRGRVSIPGKRLMISGFSLDHRGLHRALEEHGAVVVAEDDWWGSRCAGDNIAEGSGDLLKALFEKYYQDTPSPRVFPFEAADAWFQKEAVAGIDGVVFYLPPEDCTAGWDYPRRLRFLDERGIPHLKVREDARSLSRGCRADIDEFVRSITVRDYA